MIPVKKVPRLVFTTHTMKPHDVRMKLWNDFRSQCKKFVKENPYPEQRMRELNNGVSIILEGRDYVIFNIISHINLPRIRIVDLNDFVHRDILGSKIRDGIPMVDMVELQKHLDEMMTSVIMTE